MQLTNNLFLHHLTPRFYTSSPVFQEQCRPSSPPQCRQCRSGGAIFVSKNYGFFLQKLSMMTGEAKKKARLACNPLLGPWTLQGVTAYKAKHTYIEAL